METRTLDSVAAAGGGRRTPLDMKRNMKPAPEGHSGTHPGIIINEEFFIPMGITQSAAAKATGIPQSRLSAILSGQRAITTDTAAKLGCFFGVNPRNWLNLQAEYDLREYGYWNRRQLGFIRSVAPATDIEKTIRRRKAKNSNAWAGFDGKYRKFTIGMLLAEHREKAGLTLAELARRTGMKKTALSRLENHGKNVTYATMVKYVDATHIPLTLTINTLP